MSVHPNISENVQESLHVSGLAFKGGPIMLSRCLPGHYSCDPNISQTPAWICIKFSGVARPHFSVIIIIDLYQNFNFWYNAGQIMPDFFLL